MTRKSENLSIDGRAGGPVAMAPLVDRVLGEQLQRLEAYVEKR